MYNGEKLIDRPLRWGMVGGGRTDQVGYKHRTGALRDNTSYRLVCGAFVAQLLVARCAADRVLDSAFQLIGFPAQFIVIDHYDAPPKLSRCWPVRAAARLVPPVNRGDGTRLGS